MSTYFNGQSLFKQAQIGTTAIYGLAGSGLQNRYYILSDPGSRPLLAFPEVVGYDCYTALLGASANALGYLNGQLPHSGIDIFTILRGGLNYPIEEAASSCGIPVRYMHFVSCERIIKNQEILGLDIRYQKITPSAGRTVAIGDILATGDTFRLCISYLVDEFARCGGSIRRIILFTIGGTRAVDLLEELTPQIRDRFPDFEGFDCFFFEGMFTVYTDHGASGINTPNIDFGWKGGIVTPDFREYIAAHPDALLEKCIIYDGGARRYEIPLHLEEVLDYWNGILERAGAIDAGALVREKLGYDGPLDYQDWQQATCLAASGDLHPLWAAEQRIMEHPADLAQLAARRIEAINQLKIQYETE